MEFSSSNQDITILRNSITQSQYIFNNKDRPVLYCNDDKVLNRVLNLVNQNVCIYNLNLFIATQRGAIKTVIYLLENCRYFTLDDYKETTINDLSLNFITLSYSAPEKNISKIELHIDPQSEKVKSLYAEKTENIWVIALEYLLVYGIFMWELFVNRTTKKVF